MMGAADPELVLRGALFTPGAVRVPRCAAGKAPGLPDTVPASHDDGYKDGLREGREEGLRRGREEGQRAGYDDGMRQGRAAAQAEAQPALEAALAAARLPLEARGRQLDAVLATLAAAVDSVWASAEDDLVALCLDTLSRVLGEALSTPEAVRAQVRQAIAAWEGRGAVVLRLHPDDARLLDESAAGGRLPPLPGRAVTCLPDPQVALGGCLLEGEGGGLDARLESILEQVKSALLAARVPAAPREASP